VFNRRRGSDREDSRVKGRLLSTMVSLVALVGLSAAGQDSPAPAGGESEDFAAALHVDGW